MVAIKIRKVKESEAAAEQRKPKKIRLKTASAEDVKPKLKISLGKSRASSEGPKMKVKLNMKHADPAEKVIKPPRLRLKPIRVPGEGYDSEDSGIEDDPLIEEGIILRVLPDMQAEYVKNSIESGDYSSVNIKWKSYRHAIVNINGVSYGAILVNLPTITEVNKSFDRKNIMKTFDVSQMLLCIKQVDNEDEVYNLQPPDTEDLVTKHYEDYSKEIDKYKKMLLKKNNSNALPSDLATKFSDEIATKSYDYKHGLSPPLYNVRNRRFRRRMDPTEFSYAEGVVEYLLKLDEEATEVTYELIDEEEALRGSVSTVNMNLLHESAVPHMPAEPRITEEKDEDDLDLEQAFESDNEETAIPAESVVEASVDTTRSIGDMSGQSAAEEEEEEEEEEDDEEDDEEEDEEEEEDGTKADGVPKSATDEKKQHNELLKEEVAELELILSQTQQRLENATNPLLKSRFVDSIKKLEKEVELKRKQLKASDELLGQGSTSPEQESKPAEDEEEDDEDAEEDEEEEEEPERREPSFDDKRDDTSATPTNTETQSEDQQFDQNDLDMMMLFGGEGDDAEE